MSTQDALQKLIFERLTGYAPLVALIEDRVYDKPPAAAVHPYVSFGPQDFRADDADCIDSEEHSVQIDCWSVGQDGKREVQLVAHAVKRALNRYVAEPVYGALVTMDVVLVRILEDPDGVTLHGVVQVDAVMESP